MQLYSLDMGHGYTPRRDELEGYLDTVLSTVTCPVVVSTHQSVGYRYPVELLVEVVERHDHVIGINLTSGDIGYLSSVVDAVDGRVDIHVGGPMHALTAMALGAQGFLSSEGNLAPRLCVEVVDAHRDGRTADTGSAFASSCGSSAHPGRRRHRGHESCAAIARRPRRLAPTSSPRPRPGKGRRAGRGPDRQRHRRRRGTAHAVSVLGTRVDRREDPALLRGGGRFVADLVPDDAAHVAYVTSTQAHGLIVGLDTADARLPGVSASTPPTTSTSTSIPSSSPG